MRSRTPNDGCGFTLVEMAVALAIIGILAAVLVPVMSNYVDQGRLARAQSDVKAIGDSIVNFEHDVGRYPMFKDQSLPLQDGNANIYRLDGPGNLPTDNTASWFANTSGNLSDQLTTNLPGWPTSASPSKPFTWKGPYLDPMADPWGNRYIVNIINARSTSTNACFVISAGPNGQIDTNFNISENGTVTAGSDDILWRIK